MCTYCVKKYDMYHRLTSNPHIMGYLFSNLFSNSTCSDGLAGISVVVVFGMVLWSILSLLFRFGGGLPEGPFGILGLTQSLSFATWPFMMTGG